MSKHLSVGLEGEHLACTYLLSEGYRLIEKNWRYRRAEIDIICEKSGVLVFVEVKTRSSNYLGDPSMAVTRSKQKHIIRAADAYVKEKDTDADIRFDIIGIVMNQHGHEIQHEEDAFYPTL